MLDDYSNDQSISYRILVNALKNEKLSHAYLFETNNYSKGFDLALAFSKYLLCPNSYTNFNFCSGCNQCHIIDDGNFPEIKIIDSDGLWIKKEQLDELQKELSKQALIGTRRVYIVNHAERLNSSAANSILKFLEEPEPNIIAILVTSNRYLLLDTIVSRCQIVSLKDFNNRFDNMSKLEKIAHSLFNSVSDINGFVTNESSIEFVDKSVSFVNYYENNKISTLLFTNKYWHSFASDKDHIDLALSICILYYRDILNYKLKKFTQFFDVDDNIEMISKNNTINSICGKINVIFKQRESLKYNINNMLLIDKLIIEMENLNA